MLFSYLDHNNYIFKCNTCIHNNNDNTLINLPSLNNSLPSSTNIDNSNINNLIMSTETQLNMLLSKIIIVTTSDTYTDNMVKSVNSIKNNIDSNDDIIIHNINIPNNDKTNFFKYLVNIICKTVDINSSIIIQ